MDSTKRMNPAKRNAAFDPATLRVALLWHGRGPVPGADIHAIRQPGLKRSSQRAICAS